MLLTTKKANRNFLLSKLSPFRKVSCKASKTPKTLMPSQTRHSVVFGAMQQKTVAACFWYFDQTTWSGARAMLRKRLKERSRSLASKHGTENKNTLDPKNCDTTTKYQRWILDLKQSPSDTGKTCPLTFIGDFLYRYCRKVFCDIG